MTSNVVKIKVFERQIAGMSYGFKDRVLNIVVLKCGSCIETLLAVVEGVMSTPGSGSCA